MSSHYFLIIIIFFIIAFTEGSQSEKMDRSHVEFKNKRHSLPRKCGVQLEGGYRWRDGPFYVVEVLNVGCAASNTMFLLLLV